jgi:hypothetical protein
MGLDAQLDLVRGGRAHRRRGDRGDGEGETITVALSLDGAARRQRQRWATRQGQRWRGIVATATTREREPPCNQ